MLHVYIKLQKDLLGLFTDDPEFRGAVSKNFIVLKLVRLGQK